MSSGQAVEHKSIAGKYLTFAISVERYGMQILNVQEIIGVPKITPVPRTQSFIKGVINLRGKIIPVIDLRRKFGLEPIPYDERTCIIVANVTLGSQQISLGVIVDTVLEVINFTQDEIEPSPNYGNNLDTSFILGIGKRDGCVNVLVDIQKILSNTEKQQVAQALA